MERPAIEFWLTEQFRRREQTPVEKARQFLTLDRVRAVLQKRQQRAELEEAQRYLGMLSEIAERGVQISDEADIEELIDIMTELSFQRAKLSRLYTERGIKYMRAVRDSFLQYFTVRSDLRHQRDEFVPYYWYDKPNLSEASELLLGLSIDEKIPGYQFTARDLLRMLELELAAADSASNLGRPLLRLKRKAGESYYYMVPTPEALIKYRDVTEKMKKGEMKLNEWIVRLQVPPPR